MDDFQIKDQGIEEFLEDLSSSKPSPGGGGASALAGAFGCSLGLMVCNLTVGKKKYADIEDEVRSIAAHLETMKQSFYLLADKDREVFLPLAACYKMPKETEEEKRVRDLCMEEALYTASGVPLAVMESAVSVCRDVLVIAKKGSIMAVSDAGVAGNFLRAALEGALFNVRINVKSMKNKERKNSVWEKGTRLLTEGLAITEEIQKTVEGRL